MRARSIAEVEALFERYGADRYDETLSQVAHAEQSAALASGAGAAGPLVVAALLHDVGHLLELADGAGGDRDLRHEARGAGWLADLFPSTVTAPIALHVRAKRYRCAVDPAYLAVLSPGSVASLARQGGPMTADEAASFERNPGWRDAVALRGWDDEAKVLGLEVPPWGSYRPLLAAMATR